MTMIQLQLAKGEFAIRFVRNLILRNIDDERISTLIDTIINEKHRSKKKLSSANTFIFILKNIDDKHFTPIVIEILNEEIHKYQSKAQKCYFLEKDEEAEKLEIVAEELLFIKKFIIKKGLTAPQLALLNPARL